MRCLTLSKLCLLSPGKNCRITVMTEYPLELQAQRYIELHRQVLDKKLKK
jgi:hypothetical protein